MLLDLQGNVLYSGGELQAFKASHFFEVVKRVGHFFEVEKETGGPGNDGDPLQRVLSKSANRSLRAQ